VAELEAELEAVAQEGEGALARVAELEAAAAEVEAFRARVAELEASLEAFRGQSTAEAEALAAAKDAALLEAEAAAKAAQEDAALIASEREQAHEALARLESALALAEGERAQFEQEASAAAAALHEAQTHISATQGMDATDLTLLRAEMEELSARSDAEAAAADEKTLALEARLREAEAEATRERARAERAIVDGNAKAQAAAAAVAASPSLRARAASEAIDIEAGTLMNLDGAEGVESERENLFRGWREVPLFATAPSRVQRVMDFADRFSSAGTRIFRISPIVRFAIIVYWVCLHLWLVISVCRVRL